MPYAIICLFLILTTFMSLPTPEQIRTPKEIMTIIGFLCVIWACLSHGKPKKFILNKWLWLFVLWSIIDTFWIRFRHFSEGGNPLVTELAITTAFSRLFYVFLAVMTIEAISNCTTLFGTKEFSICGFNLTPLKRNFSFEVSSLIKFISVIGVLLAGYVLFIQVPGFDQYLRVVGETEIREGSFTHRLVGTLGNPSVMATWFAMVIPCLLYSRRYIGFGMVWVCLILMQGKTGIAAGFIGTLFYLLFNNRKTFIALTLALLLTGSVLQLTNTKDVIGGAKNIVYSFVNDDEGRFRVWKQTLIDLKEMPLTGNMLGSFQYVQAPKLVPLFSYSTIWRNPHNEYLRILFEGGIVALFLYLGFCFSILWKFLKSEKTRETVALASCSIAFSVCCLTLFPLQIGTTVFLQVLFVSLLMNQLNKEEKCFVKF